MSIAKQQAAEKQLRRSGMSIAKQQAAEKQLRRSGISVTLYHSTPTVDTVGDQANAPLRLPDEHKSIQPLASLLKTMSVGWCRMMIDGINRSHQMGFLPQYADYDFRRKGMATSRKKGRPLRAAQRCEKQCTHTQHCWCYLADDISSSAYSIEFPQRANACEIHVERYRINSITDKTKVVWSYLLVRQNDVLIRHYFTDKQLKTGLK